MCRFGKRPLIALTSSPASVALLPLFSPSPNTAQEYINILPHERRVLPPRSLSLNCTPFSLSRSSSSPSSTTFSLHTCTAPSSPFSPVVDPMGKKGGITSIFSRLAVDSPTAGGPASPPWPWPSCREPQTASFRADGTRCGPLDARHRRLPGEMYKTLNSVYFDSRDASSCLAEEEEDTEVLDDDSFSTTTASEEWSEAVIRTLSRTTSTDRFFFDMQGPATNSNSILEASSASPARTPPAKEEEEEKTAELSDKEKLPAPYKALMEEESVAVAVDSEDPHRDFRASMEEMVAAHGLRGWDALEELLVWYLRVNARHHHPLIVGAFVDLLVGLADSPSAAAATTTTSSSSTSSSSASSSSTKSTSTTTTTSTGGGGLCRTATAAATEQCGGGNEACASCSSSSGVTSDQDEVGEKAGDCNIRRS